MNLSAAVEKKTKITLRNEYDYKTKIALTMQLQENPKTHSKFDKPNPA